MWLDNLLEFIRLGFQHIIPWGLDHILFIIALFLTARRWQGLLIQVTFFTLAHTLTLGLASAGLVSVPGWIVEPAIALSISAMALDAIFDRGKGRWRLLLIFLFGLLHGLGFASQMVGYLEGADFAIALGGFNVGVELGQLTVLAITGLVAFGVKRILGAFKLANLYRMAVVIPVAVAIACVGAYWAVERSGVLNLASL
ncbi:MAG: HupE/UreJ family protein [Hyphomonadaceae bacterium]